MLSWALIYALTLSKEEMIAVFTDPELALRNAYDFADEHPDEESEVIEIATRVWDRIDAQVVKLPESNGTEADPKA